MFVKPQSGVLIRHFIFLNYLTEDKIDYFLFTLFYCEASIHHQVQQDNDTWACLREFLPGPAYIDVVSWHHAGEQSRAALRHLDVVGRRGDLQVRWTITSEWDVDFKPLTQSIVVTLRYSDLCWWISEITTTIEVCWIHNEHALFILTTVLCLILCQRHEWNSLWTLSCSCFCSSCCWLDAVHV